MRIDNQGNIKEYVSVHAAARDSNVSPGNVVKVCKGERNKANGYAFKYSDDKSINDVATLVNLPPQEAREGCLK